MNEPSPSSRNRPSGPPHRLPEIVIDLEKLRHINCGLGRFSLYLGQQLLQLSEDTFRPTLLLPDGAERHFPQNMDRPYDVIPVKPWRKERFQRWTRPLLRRFSSQRPDLWHVTNQASKYLPIDPSVPVVLTIHDLYFLYTEKSPKRISRKLNDIQQRVNRCSAIVTDSQYVADDLARNINLGRRPVHVVPLGMSPTPSKAAQRPDWLPQGKFAFSIGNFLPHKNFHTLVKMIRHLPDLTLVVAGKNQTPYGEQVLDLVSTAGVADRVFLPGMVTDEDRQWLYEECDVFLFPSLTEGFGFPVLEAMQCGKPVVMSRLTSLPEIAGDHGFYFDSFEEKEMAVAVEEALVSFDKDPDAGVRAQAHAGTYTWQATAQGYLKVYAEMLGF